MDRVVVEFCVEVDDLDRVALTLLDADPATLAQTDPLGVPDLFGLTLERPPFIVMLLAGDDALLARAVRGAVTRTLVVAPVGLTPVEVDDRDAVVRHRQIGTPSVRSTPNVTNQRTKVMNTT